MNKIGYLNRKIIVEFFNGIQLLTSKYSLCKKLVIVIGFFVASTLLLASDNLNVPKCTNAPVLDGKLDDACWKLAGKIEKLYILNNDTPTNDTTIYLVRDKKWLYIGFKCLNPNIAHVDKTVFKHDDLYPEFYGSDSVEVYIKPEEKKDRYYWFGLTFNNVTFEHSKNKNKKNAAWNAPWRSRTSCLLDGWTAEVAIPMFALECDNLSKAKINIVRNFRAIEFDWNGAKQHEKTVLSALKACDRSNLCDFTNYIEVTGLGGFKPEIPFTPRITMTDLTGLREKDGKYFYNVKIKLETGSAIPGKVNVQIIETVDGKDIKKLSELVNLTGKRELVLSVPTKDFQERMVHVVLADPENGNILFKQMIKDISALSVFKKAFVGRDYYTTEPIAKIQLLLDLPEAIISKSVLILELNNEKILEFPSIKANMMPEIPLSALKLGDNTIVIRVITDSKELTRKTLVIKRLAPRPGFEVKTDFIKGVTLKDSKPFFPVGICIHSQDHEDLFKCLSDVGFNTLISKWKNLGKLDKNMKLSAKYGMNVILWNSPQPLPIGMTLGTWPPPPVTLPLKKRLALQKKWYEKLKPEIIKEVKILRKHRNLLAYWNVDEPNLLNPEERIATAEQYYKTVEPIDPYHPQFLLYSKHIPYGDNWTRWGQILGYDVYPRPFIPNVRNNPGLYTAIYAYDLRERCRQDNKVMWFVPLASNLGGSRSPIGMNKAHMLCQAYTAVIYGSRGLLYYALPCVSGVEAWDALRTVNNQMKELAPALLNGDIAQNISYTPDNYRPKERKFPMVNVAVFKYPNGDYLLMAVNIMSFAVDTNIMVGGIKSGAKLFDKEGCGRLSLDGELFTDKIEPYGVRAYRIKLADNPKPIQVSLDMTALKNEKMASVDIPGIVSQVKRGKNHIPNPCFKQQFVKGIPDFYKPTSFPIDHETGRQGSTWYVDNETMWNGNPSLRIFRGKGNLGRGMCGLWYPPESDKPMKMTFSFYAKCNKVGAKMSANVFDKKWKPITLTSTAWTRYSITGVIPPGVHGNLDGRSFQISSPTGATLWITGLQMEAGEIPTEFQDDSIPKNTD